MTDVATFESMIAKSGEAGRLSHALGDIAYESARTEGAALTPGDAAALAASLAS